MCGIVGFFSHDPNLSISGTDLARMRDRMEHRGPDDAGIFIYGDNSISVGLGHRRLSIIDLSSSGHQPMSTADETLWVVFNGEVFNYLELRQKLIDTGKYIFKSRTDTEVILYGVMEWGLEGCLKRIRGMYAFALFDKKELSLTLVRDPLGVKPLYYNHVSDRVVFASEIKAMLAVPGFQRNINEKALYHYLTFANSPAPDTLFLGVEKLEAGMYLKLDREGHASKVRYWDPTRFRPDNVVKDEHEYTEEIRRLLRQSVQRRMVSDVPFGVFLSGGVDSSLNVALMAELMDKPVETFSIGIEGDPSNEFLYARKVAEHFGTNHHEVVINDNDFISFLPKMAFFQDEPLADPVCVPLYYVSKLARDNGTIVIQVGEGSDEIFAGYGIYHLFKKWNVAGFRPYEKLPGFLRRLFYHLVETRSSPYISDAFRRACCGEPLFLGNAIAFWDYEKKQLMGGFDIHETSGSVVSELCNNFYGKDDLSRIIQLELKNRLPELLLMRVDKMSMANSIETRVPFLDEDLVEFALQIPSSLKGKNGEPKYILKKTAEGIIPREIIYRNKWGFCGSATNMVNENIVAYAKDSIMSSSLTERYFNKQYIEGIFEDHKKRKRFNSFKIWNLLNLVLWHECWFN